MAPSIVRPPAPPQRIGTILLIGGVGFLAGVAGGLAAVVFAIPVPVITIDSVFRRATPVVRGGAVLPALAPISASVVDVFLVDAGDDLPTLLPLEQRTGRGVALTSDGWMVTVRAALDGASGVRLGKRYPVVVGRDRRIRSVDRIAFDPVSELAFLHAADLDASVLPLRDRNALTIGMPLFAPTADGGLEFLTLETTAAADAPAIRSSDTWSSFLALSPDHTDVPVGTPIVDSAGAVVGIRRDAARAIPVELITSALPSLFARNAVDRNILAVTYRDASAFAYGDSGRTDGIMLERGSGGAAIGTKSPLRGLLAEGDAILAVGDDSLTARRSLPEVLQEYPIGATVRLRVQRRGAAEPTMITVPLATTRGISLLVPVSGRPAAPSAGR